ncbi:MAG: APC family permease [Candidatus ainarchaeum sp.]|nr:APC family permease [Candidatus ainarchaeum sp.]
MALHKALNFFTLTMYGIGIIVGAGIYVLVGQASGIAGNGVWISFLLGAIIASFTGLSYAELSSAFPGASGEANYLKQAFGKDWLAFLIGWLVAVVGFIAAATVSLGFAGYLAKIIPVPVVLTAIVLIVLLSIVDLFGITVSAKLNIVFTLLSLLGIFIIIALGIPKLGSVDYFQLNNGITGVLGATTLIFFAYIGFEAIVKLSEETRHARQIVPKALLASIAITSVIYVLVAISAVSIMSPAELGASTAPLADAATRASGADLGLVFTIVALFAMLSTVLVDLIVTSRLIYGMGEKREFPRIITKVYKKTGAPYVAVFVAMLGAIAMAFFSDISVIAKATTFLVFTAFLFVNLSLIAVRLKNQYYKPAFRIPLNIGRIPVTAVLGALTCGFMLLSYSLFEFGIAIVFTAIGLGIYTIEKKFGQKKTVHAKKRKWAVS